MACRPGLRLELHKRRKVSMHGNVNVSVRHTVDGSSFDDWIGHIRDQHTMRSCRATRVCSGTLQYKKSAHDHFDHRRPQKIAIGIDCRGSNSHTVHVAQRRGAPREVPTDVQHIRIGPQVFPPTWGPKPRDAFHRHSGRKQSCRTRSQLAVASTPQGKVEAPHVVLPTAIEHRGFRCGAALRRSRQQSAEE